MTKALRDALQQTLEALQYHTEQTRPIQQTTEAIFAAKAALAKPDPTIKVNSAGTVAVAQGVFWLPIDKQAPLGVRLLLINRAAGRATDGQLGSHEKFFDHYQAFPQFRR